MLFNHNIYTNSLSGKAALVVALLAGLLVSCVQIEENSDQNGYLSFSSITIDYTVSDLYATKASVPYEDLPEASDFTITVKGEGINDMVFLPGEIPADRIELPKGTYTVEATYGRNGFDGPYYHDSQDVDIIPYKESEITFNDIALSNSMLMVTLPADIDKHLKLSGIELSDGKNSVDVQAGKYVYVPSGKSVTATFSGVNSIEETKRITVSLGTFAAQHAHTFVCNLNLPQIVLPTDQSAGAWATRLYVNPATVSSGVSDEHIVYEVIDGSSTDWSDVLASSEVIEGNYHVVKGLENGKSYKVRARLGNVVSNEVPFTVDEFKDGATYKVEHAYDSNSYLTGTTVTADLKLTGILKTLHDAGLIQTTVSLKNGSQVYRTTNAISGTLSGSDTWPYIPQGTSYSLDISHSVPGDSDIVSSIVSSVTVPAPKISVNVSAYTTYDRYLDYKSGKSALSLANNSDKRLVVEERKVVLSVSNTILEKTPSLLSSSVTYNGSQLTAFSSSNTLTYDNVTYTDSQWGKYVFSASVNFDGVTASDSHDCWITGLPYSKSFNNANTDGWETSNVGSYAGSSYLCFKPSAAWALSPSFRIPSDGCNVKITTPVRSYHTNALRNYSPELYVSVSNTAVQGGSSSTYKAGIDPNIDGNFGDKVVDTAFTSSTYRVSLYVYGEKKGTDIVAFIMKSCDIAYR